MLSTASNKSADKPQLNKRQRAALEAAENLLKRAQKAHDLVVAECDKLDTRPAERMGDGPVYRFGQHPEQGRIDDAHRTLCMARSTLDDVKNAVKHDLARGIERTYSEPHPVLVQKVKLLEAEASCGTQDS